MALPMGIEAADDYSFDEKDIDKETAKKPYHLGGYGEATPALMLLDKDAAMYKVKYYGRGVRPAEAEYNLGLQLDGSVEWGMARAAVRVYSFADYTYSGWEKKSALQEGFISIKPAPMSAFDAGKKNFKWGKGYAWNPVAFIDRPKNPEDPELPAEGYYAGSMDLILSFDSPIKTVSFTPVLFPVNNRLNDDLPGKGHMNYAGKLYALVFDTDIDFIFFAGKSTADRYGFDFSRNITAGIEVHGEFAYIPDFRKKVIDSHGNLTESSRGAKNFLGGIRYLTTRDTTIIMEYFRNETGFTSPEMKDYYSFINKGYEAFETTENKAPLHKAEMMQKSGYGRMNPMINYLYVRISQKEPFDILYLTPGLSWIFNIDDRSYMIIPEILYTPVTNLELRLRSVFLAGRPGTEFGEKPNNYKFDLRARYYF